MAPHLETIYVSGWQCSSTASTRFVRRQTSKMHTTSRSNPRRRSLYHDTLSPLAYGLGCAIVSGLGRGGGRTVVHKGHAHACELSKYHGTVRIIRNTTVARVPPPEGSFIPHTALFQLQIALNKHRSPTTLQFVPVCAYTPSTCCTVLNLLVLSCGFENNKSIFVALQQRAGAGLR